MNLSFSTETEHFTKMVLLVPKNFTLNRRKYKNWDTNNSCYFSELPRTSQCTHISIHTDMAMLKIHFFTLLQHFSFGVVWICSGVSFIFGSFRIHTETVEALIEVKQVGLNLCKPLHVARSFPVHSLENSVSYPKSLKIYWFDFIKIPTYTATGYLKCYQLGIH